MGLTAWLVIIGGVWALGSVALGALIGRMIVRRDRQKPRPPTGGPS